MRTADAISLALNPSLWGGGFVTVLALRVEPPGTTRWLAAAIGAAALAVVPIASLFVLHRTGYLTDVEMRRREERSIVYATCAAAYAAGAIALIGIGASWPVWGVVTLHVPSTLLLAVLNRALKVSIHATGLSGVAAAGLVCFGWHAWPLALVAVAGCWARWSAGAHSPRELIAGAVSGIVLTGGGLELLKHLVMR